MGEAGTLAVVGAVAPTTAVGASSAKGAGDESHAAMMARRWDTLCLRWRAASRLAVGVSAATLAGMALVTYLATLLAAGNGAAPGGIVGPRALLYAWDRWDARYFYLPIAADGYTKPIEASFFPLYPALTHVAWLVTGRQHLLIAGVAVGLVGALLAFVGVGLLAAVETESPLTTFAALLLVATYPLGFFLAAPYPTGWLVAGVAFALLFARCGRWYLAAAATLAATLAHPSGGCVAVAVAWEWVASGRASGDGLAPILRTLAPRWRSGLAVLAAAPAGLAAFALVCAQAYGDPLALLASDRRYFGYERVAPWDGLVRLLGNLLAQAPWSYAQARVILDAAPLLLALALLLVLARRRALAPSQVAFVAALLLLLLCSPVEHTAFHDVALAAGRHLLAAVPLFVATGRALARRPALLAAVGYAAALAQAVCAAVYLRGAWLV